MLCMKCGTETGSEQIFCSKCLETMAKCPVKPGTAVQLPKRPDPSEKKSQTAKQPLNMREQNRRLRKRVKRLRIALLGAVLLLALSVAALVWKLQEEPTENNIGQNYNTMDTRRRN